MATPASSTDDQNLDLQRDALTKAGCARIFAEKESGRAGTKRPSYEAALAYLPRPISWWCGRSAGSAARCAKCSRRPTERDHGCCEQCGRPHGETVRHLGNSRWWDAKGETWRDDRGRKVRLRPLPAFADDDVRQTRVYLATVHLDHDPGNNAAENLRALCQRCHMLHDAPEHNRQRPNTLHRRKAIGDLFLGPYPATGGLH